MYQYGIPCDILVLWKNLNGTHRGTEECTRGAGQKRRRLAAEEEREVTARYFSAYRPPLDMATYFKYLGRVISATDYNWPEVAKNLARAKTVWRRMARILSREGGTPWAYGFFFKYVIQAVLIFGADTQVVTPRMGKALRGFQTQVVRRLTENPRGGKQQDVEIHLSGGGKGGRGVLDDGGIRQAVPEHGHTVYCYTITVRYV